MTYPIAGKRTALASGPILLLFISPLSVAFQSSVIASDRRTHSNTQAAERCRSFQFDHNSYFTSLSHLKAKKDADINTQLPQFTPLSISQSINTSTVVPHSHESIPRHGLSLEKEGPTKNRAIALLTAAVALIATTLLVILSGPGAWRYYLAGGICAAFSHSFTTPIDVIKTRQQVDESLTGLGFIKSGIKIVKDDGALALLAGLGPTTFGYLFEGALKFGIYEVLKPGVRSMLTWTATMTSMRYLDIGVMALLISGLVSGAIASIVLCPMEALRIRLVAQPEFATKGWIHGGLSMIENEGILGVFKGLTAMMSKQIPYTITKNVSFDVITTSAYKIMRTYGLLITKEMKILIPLISAMIASVLSCISSQPGDMLLSVVNAEEGDGRSRDFAKNILKKNGVRGFFVGMKTRFVHVGLIVTVQLLIYDIVKRLCGIAATGL